MFQHNGESDDENSCEYEGIHTPELDKGWGFCSDSCTFPDEVKLTEASFILPPPLFTPPRSFKSSMSDRKMTLFWKRKHHSELNNLTLNFLLSAISICIVLKPFFAQINANFNMRWIQKFAHLFHASEVWLGLHDFKWPSMQRWQCPI